MKTTFFKISLFFLIHTLSSVSFAADIIYDRLAGSDRLMIDISYKSKINDEFYTNKDQSCSKGLDDCIDDINSWINSMQNEINGQKYLSQFSNVPPHIYKPKLVEEFTKRYNKWSSEVKAGNMCYFLNLWILRSYNTNFYSLANQDLAIGNVANFQNQALVFDQFPGFGYVMLARNGKKLDLIPNNFITQSVYTRYQKFNNVSDSDLRPKLKICGQFLARYNGAAKEGTVPIQEPVFIFEASKPVEVIDPKTLKTLDTIPDEWFGYK